ncbi:hypothetical protein R3P38DRAFT_1652776 [Favolaschia claudopus]|uniref:Secreted protein n=1 Tax=Favolaschia claudopus TaxID=2862362 RepID=A0AAW0DQP0_9AGAR
MSEPSKVSRAYNAYLLLSWLCCSSLAPLSTIPGSYPVGLMRHSFTRAKNTTRYVSSSRTHRDSESVSHILGRQLDGPLLSDKKTSEPSIDTVDTCTCAASGADPPPHPHSPIPIRLREQMGNENLERNFIPRSLSCSNRGRVIAVSTMRGLYPRLKLPGCFE